MQWILLALGGASGTLLRYSVSGLASGWHSGHFPMGTFVVNIIGSFLIGFAFGMSEQWPGKNSLKLFVFTGLLGGFTTFSAFSLECIQLIKSEQVPMAILYAGLSNMLGIAFAFAGYFGSRFMLKLNGLSA
ncbi:MAG: fluoride efflux transporter CrcB [Bacteroidales bacterium]|nr:fluoride efflux transporter CrcB [Bacteroidales bacterium]